MEAEAVSRNELIGGLGVDYTAVFVPFSQSRNAKPNPKVSDLSLNWKVTIKRGRESLTTDYMQGIGHAPSYKQSVTLEVAEKLKAEAERGITISGSLGIVRKPVPKPELSDVLYSLLMDGSAIDYPDFEEWASEYGYDRDSQSAEKIYRQCLEIGLKLRRMFGDETLTKLREAFQDY